jgi:DNA repair protein RAD50
VIELMQFAGIRSFGPDESVIIKFERPLTIIVGHNGSGKTVRIRAMMF